MELFPVPGLCELFKLPGKLLQAHLHFSLTHEPHCIRFEGNEEEEGQLLKRKRAKRSRESKEYPWNLKPEWPPESVDVGVFNAGDSVQLNVEELGF